MQITRRFGWAWPHPHPYSTLPTPSAHLLLVLSDWSGNVFLFYLSSLSQVLDVSGAAVLQTALPSAKVELLDSCGHSVSLERPRKAAKLIMDFVSAQGVNGDNAKKHSWRKRYNYAGEWAQDGGWRRGEWTVEMRIIRQRWICTFIVYCKCFLWQHLQLKKFKYN